MSTQRVGLPERGAPPAMRALRSTWGRGPRGGALGGVRTVPERLGPTRRGLPILCSHASANPANHSPRLGMPGAASLPGRAPPACAQPRGRSASRACGGQDPDGKQVGPQRPSAWANPFQEGSCRASAPFVYAIPGFFFCGKRQRAGAAGCDVVPRGRNGQDRCEPDPLPRGTPKLRTRSSERPRRGMDGACRWALRERTNHQTSHVDWGGEPQHELHGEGAQPRDRCAERQRLRRPMG